MGMVNSAFEVTMQLQCHWRRQLWGTGARAPSTYNSYILVYFDLYKYESDFDSYVASCKNPVTFACAPPGNKSWRRHCTVATINRNTVITFSRLFTRNCLFSADCGNGSVYLWVVCRYVCRCVTLIHCG